MRAPLLAVLVFPLLAAGCERERIVPTTLRWEPDIRPIFERACVVCHSEADTLKGPYAHGVNLEDYDHVIRYRKGIYASVVVKRSMPGPNAAGIVLTDEERARIGAWLRGGAPR